MHDAGAGLSGGHGGAGEHARSFTRYAESVRRRGDGCCAGKAKGLDLFVLDAPHLYDRPGNPYLGPDGKDWPDNCAALRRAWPRSPPRSAAALVPDFVPDIIHCP